MIIRVVIVVAFASFTGLCLAQGLGLQGPQPVQDIQQTPPSNPVVIQSLELIDRQEREPSGGGDTTIVSDGNFSTDELARQLGSDPSNVQQRQGEITVDAQKARNLLETEPTRREGSRGWRADSHQSRSTRRSA